MTSPDEPMVAGVAALDLFEIFQKMKRGPDEEGMGHFSIQMDRSENALFVRAWERMDAELRADDRLGLAPEHSRRTTKQRRFDAFMLLFEKTCEAVERYWSSRDEASKS